MKIDFQTVLIAAAVVGAGALALLPRRQAAPAPAPQATGAGAAFVNMSLDGAYSRMKIADVMPSASWAGLNVYATPYIPGLGSFAP